MIILGLLLLAAVAVVAVELIVANDGRIAVHMWRWAWQVDAFWLAVVGAGLLVAGVLGLALLRAGSRHSLRLRRERRQLAAENRRLAKRVEAGPPPAGASSPGTQPTTAQPASNEYPTQAGNTYSGQRVEGRPLDR
jgi:hypothetical protein